MTTQNDGGPAFPLDVSKDGIATIYGMSLRDYFAAKALTGLLAAPNSEIHSSTYAADAYRLADAMLAAREAKR